MPIVMITPETLQAEDGPFVKALSAAGFEVRFPKNPILTRGLGPDSETIAELAGVDATIAGGEFYKPLVLDALPRLKVIARAGVGYDRVDVSAATQRGVAVTITPNSNHEAVAEFALALLFAVTKRIVAWDKTVRAGGWPREVVLPLRGRTFGVLGLGRIGRSTAVRAAALGMQVIATEKFPNADFVRQHGIELVEFDALLARSDYLSIHCPLGDDTRGLFNKSVFARMKPGAILINTARGPLVVERDLYDALRSGQLRGAGLDVFEQEPPDASNPLFTLDNVVVSPHKAGNDELSNMAMGVEAAECIIRLARNEWPEGAVVNDSLRASWNWESRRAH